MGRQNDAHPAPDAPAVHGDHPDADPSSINFTSIHGAYRSENKTNHSSCKFTQSKNAMVVSLCSIVLTYQRRCRYGTPHNSFVRNWWRTWWDFSAVDFEIAWSFCSKSTRCPCESRQATGAAQLPMILTWTSVPICSWWRPAWKHSEAWLVIWSFGDSLFGKKLFDMSWKVLCEGHFSKRIFRHKISSQIHTSYF